MRPHSSSIQKHNGRIHSVPAPVNMCFILDIKFSVLKDCPQTIDCSGCGYTCLQVNSIYIKILGMLTLLIFNIVFWLCIASEKRVFGSPSLGSFCPGSRCKTHFKNINTENGSEVWHQKYSHRISNTLGFNGDLPSYKPVETNRTQ